MINVVFDGVKQWNCDTIPVIVFWFFCFGCLSLVFMMMFRHRNTLFVKVSLQIKCCIIIMAKINANYGQWTRELFKANITIKNTAGRTYKQIAIQTLFVFHINFIIINLLVCECPIYNASQSDVRHECQNIPSLYVVVAEIGPVISV